MDNNNITKYNKQSTQVSNKMQGFIQSLEEADKLADIVINSETFGKAFEKWVDDYDEDGKVLLDNDGNKLRKLVKSKHDVIAAIVLGSELGITPMAAISLGTMLNAQAYAKVLRGKKLGLDPMTSMQLIHAIPTQNGVTYSTGIHVISGTLLKNNIKFKITEDAEPITGYVDVKNKPIKFDSSIHIVVDEDTTERELQDAVRAGKKPVIRKVIDMKTTVVFSRDGYDDLSITYTLQEAIDAGLYKGVSTDGDKVSGKPNWNNHPKTHLRNRAITIGGRIIAADYLDGMYSNEEASEFTNYEVLDEEVNLESKESKEK
jgi:hypothetical protein